MYLYLSKSDWNIRYFLDILLFFLKNIWIPTCQGLTSSCRPLSSIENCINYSLIDVRERQILNFLTFHLEIAWVEKWSLIACLHCNCQGKLGFVSFFWISIFKFSFHDEGTDKTAVAINSFISNNTKHPWQVFADH